MEKISETEISQKKNIGAAERPGKTAERLVNAAGEPLKVAFHSLGCKVNQYETECLMQEFENLGCKITGANDFADIYIINTCSVTHLADRKSRQQIRKMRKINPDAVIAATGCYVQVSPDDIVDLDTVDIICGTNEKHNIPAAVMKFIKSGEQIVQVRDYDNLNCYYSQGLLTRAGEMTRAYVKIEEGCNRFCTYCIIPYSRGPVRSRCPEEIEEEVRGLIENGYKEIVLTGINTALYGSDLGFDGIEPLIKRLNAIDADFRIRLSSLEPTVINAEYVAKLLDYEKLCHHLHLSLQSGSDRILKKMNRHHNRSEYLKIVEALRKIDPGYGITTDIIAGFPGETEEDFKDSMKMVEEAGFSKVHVFRYSKRKGTPAAKMSEQIDPRVKKDRAARLIETAENEAERFFSAETGNIREVLFEEKLENGVLTGYTDNYIKVYAEGADTDYNRFRKVKLLSRFRDGMKGDIVK